MRKSARSPPLFGFREWCRRCEATAILRREILSPKQPDSTAFRRRNELLSNGRGYRDLTRLRRLRGFQTFPCFREGAEKKVLHPESGPLRRL